MMDGGSVGMRPRARAGQCGDDACLDGDSADALVAKVSDVERGIVVHVDATRRVEACELPRAVGECSRA